MRKISLFVFILFQFALLFVANAGQVEAFSTNVPHGLTKIDETKVSAGYTLFAPLKGVSKDSDEYKMLLINNAGEVVHEWKLMYEPGPYGFLLENGNLLVEGNTHELVKPPAQGGGGLIQEMDWNGNVVWEYQNKYLHHDFGKLPNGNIIALTWEPMSEENRLRVKGGTPGTEIEGEMWSDILIEVDYQTKETVWSWRVEDNLDIEKFPLQSFVARNEYTHGNSIEYIPAGNAFTNNEAVLVSLRQLDTVFVIDKKTNAVVWSFGGGVISKQHDATVTDQGTVLIFNNGVHGKAGMGGFHIPSSKVVEVDPKTSEVVWEYTGDGLLGTNFFSSLMGSAQRLPNGNTLITESMTGRIFEVTPDKEIVWEYLNPYLKDKTHENMVFRAYKYNAEINFPQDLAVTSKKDSFIDLSNELNKIVNLKVVVALAISNLILLALLIKKRV